MVSALKKAIAPVLVCTALLTACNVDASMKYYRYNGNLPFVEMMLEMMAMMGMIQRVPANGLYGGYAGYGGGGYGALSSRLSQWGWPNGGYSPYSSYLPYSGYSSYGGYSPYSNYTAFPYSGYDWPGTGYGSGIPLSINPLLGFRGGQPAYSSWNYPYDSVYGPYDAAPFDRNLNRAVNYRRYGYYDDGYDDACHDGICDGYYSGHRTIDGLWVARNGEMLGLRDGRFLWTDSDSAYSTGVIERTPVLMRAYIDDSDRQVVYRYKLRGNELLTIDASGTLRIFRRVPINQASAYLQHHRDAAAAGDGGARTDPGDFTGIDSGIYTDPYTDPLYDLPDYSIVNGRSDYGNWFTSPESPD